MPAVLTACSPGAVPVPPVHVSGETEQTCRRLVDDLPDEVADQPRREVRPADALGAAWGDPAIVVTCGGPPPVKFGPGATCLTVDGVDWFLDDAEVAEPGEQQGTVTISTVKREETVALTLPGDYWPPATALADVSPVVKKDVPATSRCH